MFKLITRLYEPKTGAVRFHGENAADYDLTSWRSRFAYVFQRDGSSAARCAKTLPTVSAAR